MRSGAKRWKKVNWYNLLNILSDINIGCYDKGSTLIPAFNTYLMLAYIILSPKEPSQSVYWPSHAYTENSKSNLICGGYAFQSEHNTKGSWYSTTWRNWYNMCSREPVTGQTLLSLNDLLWHQLIETGWQTETKQKADFIWSSFINWQGKEV